MTDTGFPSPGGSDETRPKDGRAEWERPAFQRLALSRAGLTTDVPQADDGMNNKS
jgi:hypothetical protein